MIYETEQNMTRKGKIARLPRAVRDELNRRLDNGEPGVRLVVWLNGLPEVQRVLKDEFAGREINDQNLTEWKSGGYSDWQAQQETVVLTKELKANRKELAGAADDSLAECLATVVEARYAAVLHGWDGEMTEEMCRKLRGLRWLSQEVVRLRRGDRDLERMKIERESLELRRQKTEEGMKKKFEEWAEEADFRERMTPKMTQEEASRELHRILYGKEKEAKTDGDGQ